MVEIRQFLLLFIFVSFCVGLVVFSQNVEFGNLKNSLGQRNNSEADIKSESRFLNVDLFVFKSNSPFLQFKSKKLVVDGVLKSKSFLSPVGIVYTENKLPVHYSANRGRFDDIKNELLLNDTVTIKTDDSWASSDKVVYDLNKDIIKSLGNVKTKTVSKKNGDKIHIDAEKVTIYPQRKISEYGNSVKGKIERKKVYEDSIFFKSDRLNMNGNTLIIELQGNVFLQKQEVKAHALRGEIFLENYNKKLKYYALYDDIRVTETIKVNKKNGDQDTIIRKAYAEKLEGVVSDEKIILTGYPKVFQGSDIIKGNKITLRENTEIIEVDDASTNLILK